MPELPEVETVLRSIQSFLVGRTILRAEFFSPLVTSGDGRQLASQLRGRRILELQRHGKHLLLCMGDGSLDIHLRMTGKLRVDGLPSIYTRALLTLDQGFLRFDDVRQFGKMVWREGRPPVGPDVLGIGESEFVTAVRRYRGRIKSLLLNQKVLSGLGNIYADEVLFKARIHPASVANNLSLVRLNRLHQAIQETLQSAIEAGGSSISDYVDGEGRRGSFQNQHQVYGREGQHCHTCGAEIRRVVIGQRGTHFCPHCQRR